MTPREEIDMLKQMWAQATLATERKRWQLEQLLALDKESN